MRHFAVFILFISLCLVHLSGIALCDTKVVAETNNGPGLFQFPSIKPPAINDIGAESQWSIAQGKADANSGRLAVIHNGQVPDSDDSPADNFFFAAGSKGGSIVVDLGSVQAVEEIVTYSRHASTRAPQVFTVWTATGAEPGFTSAMEIKLDPAKHGWKLLTRVDTRTVRPGGTQHAVSITSDEKKLGEYRYIRFDVVATEYRDPFGNTFFSEIDILKPSVAVNRLSPPQRREFTFESLDNRFKFTMDTSLAPELHDWSEKELKPVIQQWYPKIVDMLPSEGFEAPRQVRFQFLPAEKMQGIPAWAQNDVVSMNAGWIRGELNREARGAIVHEMVHVVQDYQRLSGGRRGPPGWIVEGIPDYIRWFLYEPESKGALLNKQALASAKHDASYRTTGNFIDWVIRTHDSRGDLLQRLNAAARHGKYSSATWKELTGKSESELADGWRAQ